jgi:hypothetical protein
MKAYRNTGTVASPVWAEVSEIGDLSISDFTRGIAELKRRANEYTKGLPSLFQMMALEFRLHFGLGQTQYEAIRDAHLNGTVEEWAIMSGDIAYNSYGLRCPFIVEQFPWDQPLEDVSGHDVRLVIGYMTSGGSEVNPSWYTVPTTTTT